MMINEIETHPFKAYVPKNATIVIVGSFPGRDVTHKVPDENEWFYGTKRNQFWKIISGVYKQDLLSKKDKQALFQKHGIGVVDIFLKIKRTENNNTDSNLQVIEFNDKELESIVNNSNIKKIYFTSKFVEKVFNKLFPGVNIGESLPSPSPRYARMSLQQKIDFYTLKLPS